MQDWGSGLEWTSRSSPRIQSQVLTCILRNFQPLPRSHPSSSSESLPLPPMSIFPSLAEYSPSVMVSLGAHIRGLHSVASYTDMLCRSQCLRSPKCSGSGTVASAANSSQLTSSYFRQITAEEMVEFQSGVRGMVSANVGSFV